MALRDLIQWSEGSRNLSLHRNEGRFIDDAIRSLDVTSVRHQLAECGGEPDREGDPSPAARSRGERRQR